MNRTRTAALVALFVSLGLNIFCTSSLAALKHELAGLKAVTAQLKGLDGSFAADIATVRSQIYEMNRMGRWYSPPSLELGTNTETGKPNTKLIWTFGQLSRDACVGLSYRIGDTEWKEVEAVRLSGNMYEAAIELSDSDLKPVISTSFSSDKPQSAALAVESGFGPSYLEYVIHADDAGQLRSGEPEFSDISKVAPCFVANVTLTARPKQNHRYTVAVRQIHDGFGEATVQSIKAMLYLDSDGAPAQTVRLSKPETHGGSAQGPTLWIEDILVEPDTNPVMMEIAVIMSDQTTTISKISLD